jgi:transposase, IS6 family
MAGQAGARFGRLRTAGQTLAGYEAMAMIRMGQVRNIGGRNMRAQTAFVARLFEVIA